MEPGAVVLHAATSPLFGFKEEYRLAREYLDRIECPYRRS